MRTLLIDNTDSFTYNLYALLEGVDGISPTVVPNDLDPEAIDFETYDAIVISPGPGSPTRDSDLGLSAAALDLPTVPILGVCLGFQAICHAAGATVAPGPDPVHGVSHRVLHDGDGLFAGIPAPQLAMRYHSLVVTDLPPVLRPTAHTADGIAMGIEHLRLPRWGVQFHPESIGSEHGRDLVANFLELARAHAARIGRPLRAKRGEPRRLPAPEPPHATGAARPRYRILHRRLPEIDTRAGFHALYADAPYAGWFDSGGAESGEYSVLADASGPLAEVLRHDAARRTTEVLRDGRVVETVAGDYLPLIDARLRALRDVAIPADVPPGFTTGYLGWFGHELAGQTIGAPMHPSDTPDALHFLADRAVVVDHAAAGTHLLALVDDTDPTAAVAAADWLDHTTRRLADIAPPPAHEYVPAPVAPPAADLADELTDLRPRYLDAIAEIRRRIASGDTYEVNLTTTISTAAPADPLATYERMRSLSPNTPFNTYLRAGDVTVLSLSPERFVRVTANGRVTAQPIKGTRPRSADPIEDERLRTDLATSIKDRAENVMIVDLMRNDLTHVCVPAGVRVPELYGIHTFSTVHQMISTVTGTLAPGRSAVDCIAAAFPPGSMTGAPKRRTCEIITELEPHARGLYAGTMGYLSVNGAADLSVVIRTIICHGDTASFGIGGAITWGSDPDSEFEEICVKGRPLWSVLREAAE